MKLGTITFYCATVEQLCGADVLGAFRRRLKEIFGDAVNADLKEPGISLSAVEHHLTEVKELVLWVRDNVRQ